mgnify:CR=1 FL=1
MPYRGLNSIHDCLFEENAFLLTIIDDILSLDNEIEEIEIKVVE